MHESRPLKENAACTPLVRARRVQCSNMQIYRRERDKERERERDRERDRETERPFARPRIDNSSLKLLGAARFARCSSRFSEVGPAWLLWWRDFGLKLRKESYYSDVMGVVTVSGCSLLCFVLSLLLLLLLQSLSSRPWRHKTCKTKETSLMQSCAHLCPKHVQVIQWNVLH